MGDIASHLEYEFTNPVQGIKTSLDRLKGFLPEVQEAKTYFDAAHNGCKRISRILLKMKEFFRPSDKQKSPTDINKLLIETVRSFEAEFNNLNIGIVTNLTPDLPSIMGIATRLREVFTNIIVNSNAAMPDGGQLRIGSRFDQERNCIILTFEDTGAGIPEEKLNGIFDVSFNQSPGQTSIGLGLSICLAVVKEHDGRIEVTSTEGKGTAFEIVLPV